MKGATGFVNEFDLHESTLNEIINYSSVLKGSLLNIGDLAYHFTNFLTQKELQLINEQINEMNWIPVGKDGILKNYKEGDEIGSWRMTCYEPKLAEALWSRIKDEFPTIRTMNEFSPTDWDGSKEWEPIGINPAFRFIRYNKNEFLVPHYDAPYIQDENVRSLSSLVLYLSNNKGGSTRFIHDEQSILPLSQRTYDDWLEEASDELVYFKVKPVAGDGLIFDHRLLHDSERIKDEQIKTIVRTDIMYRRVR